MDRWTGKIAVITGASSGIGLAIAKYLTKEGMIVVGLARRKEKMQEEMKTVKGKGKFFGYECDVAKEENVINIFEKIQKTFGKVHVLVNNAGVMIPGKILESSKETWDKMISVNVMGLLYCTQQAVKMMKESGEEGHIININSVAGHRIIRNTEFALNVYPATKYAVTALTASMEMELLGSKIRTTSISPGYVKTEITMANSNKDMDDKLANIPALESEDIAECVVYVLGAAPRVQVTELTIRPLGELF